LLASVKFLRQLARMPKILIQYCNWSLIGTSRLKKGEKKEKEKADFIIPK